MSHDIILPLRESLGIFFNFFPIYLFCVYVCEWTCHRLHVEIRELVEWILSHHVGLWD